MADKPLKFGQAASDYVPPEDGGEIYIKTFKDPSTQVRICPAVRINDRGTKVYGSDAWAMEREHYDAELQISYPCAERFDVKCVGEQSDDEDTRQRSRKYYINAVDEHGDLRVYKFGVKLYKIFKGREARARGIDPTNLQPLSDRDYNIIRSGKGFDTLYDPEPGDKYEVKWPSPLHDIDQILTDRYQAAVEAYKGPKKKAAANDPWQPPEGSETEPPDFAKPKDEEPSDGDWAEEDWHTWGDGPTDVQIDSAETGTIKLWLDAQKVEYPARAPRARLVAAAKKHAEPPF